MTKYVGTKTLEVLEGAENYNRWISERLRPYIQSPALEIGAGTGNISEKFLNFQNITLTDLDSNLVEILRNKFAKRKNASFETLDISKSFSAVKNKYKTVYSVNVLEHIRDDENALRNMYKHLDKYGKVVLLVPAKKSAYTSIDKKLGHFRRYEKSEIAKKMKKAGFKNITAEYFNMLGLASWYLRDKIDSKNSHLKPSHVKAFDWIVPVLMKVEPKQGLPFGISLIVVGERK